MPEMDAIVFQITADDRPLLRDLAKIRQQLAAQKFALRASLDRSAIDKDLAAIATRPATVKIGSDTTQARGTFADFLQSVNRQRSVVKISADTSAAIAALDAIRPKPITAKVTIDRTALDALTPKPITIPAHVRVDRTALDSIRPKPIDIPAKLKIDRAAYDAFIRTLRPITLPVGIRVNQAQLNALQRVLGRSASIRIGADDRQARAAIDNLRRMIVHLRHEAATLRIRFDDRQASASLRAINQQVAALVQQLNAATAAAGRIQVPPMANHAGGGRGFFGSFAAGGLGAITANALGGGRFATGGAGLGAGIGNAIGGPMGAAAGGTLGAAGGSVADAQVGTTARGLQSLAELQRYEATLRAVIPDQEKANALLNDLKALNLQLPTVEMGTLADSAVKLAGAGLDSATLPQDIQAIMDAAATSSDGVAIGTKRVVRAISQMRTNQKLLGEELNQLTETGIPAAQILSRQMGMSIEDIKKASQAGEIAIDDIIKSLLKGFREERGGALAAQSKTLEGQLAGLRKKYDEFAKRISEPLFEPLTDALNALNQAIDAGAFNQLAEAMQAVNEAGIGFLSFVTALSKATKETEPEKQSPIRDAEAAAGDAAKDAASQAGNTIGTVGRIAGLANPLGVIGEAIGAIRDPSEVSGAARSFQSFFAGQSLNNQAEQSIPALVGALPSADAEGALPEAARKSAVRAIFAANTMEPEKILGGEFQRDTAIEEAASAFNSYASASNEDDNPAFVKRMSELSSLMTSGRLGNDFQGANRAADALDTRANSGSLSDELSAEMKSLADAIRAMAEAAKSERDRKETEATNQNTASAVGGMIGEQFGKLQGLGKAALGFAGSLPGMAADSIKQNTFLDVAAIPGGLEKASYAMRIADRDKTRETLRTDSDNRRFDKAETEIPDLFKKFTAGLDPEMQKLAEGASLTLKQQRNAQGGFDPVLSAQLADMTAKRGTQETGMTDLNRIVQGSIDEAYAREQTKKQIELQERLNGLIAEANSSLQGIKDNTGKPREAVIATG